MNIQSFMSTFLQFATRIGFIPEFNFTSDIQDFKAKLSDRERSGLRTPCLHFSD